MLGPSLPSTPICLLRRPTVVVVAHDSVVWKLLNDFEHYAGKLPNCKSCKVYSRSKNMMMRTERIKVCVPAGGCHIPCHTHRLSLYVLVTPNLMWQYAVRLFALVDTASWHAHSCVRVFGAFVAISCVFFVAACAVCRSHAWTA